MKLYKKIFWLTIFLFIILPSCFPDTSGQNPDLTVDYFYYPVALTVTKDANYLLVVNSNFDLLYNGGTISVINLDSLDVNISACRQADGGGCGKDLYFAPFEDELTDEYSNIRLTHVDYLMEEETIKIGSYAGTISLSPEGNQLYIAVQGDGSVTYVDIDERQPEQLGSKRLLNCRDDESWNIKGIQTCSNSHEIIRGPSPSYSPALPSSPYAIYSLNDPDTNEKYIVTGHLLGGEISLLKLNESNIPILINVNDDFPEGTTGIAFDPVSNSFLAVNRMSSDLQFFYIYKDSIIPGRTITIEDLSPASDQRSAVFSPDGSKLYVTSRKPPSIITYDVSIQSNGMPEDRITSIISLGNGPSYLKLYQIDENQYYLMVVCFSERAIYVIDPLLNDIIAVINTGVGPHDLSFDYNRKIAYLTNFTESTVSVIDLDSTSSYYFNIIFNLGKPKHPRELE